MSPTEAVLIALAGVAAGTINTVVGSGTLITFPTLLAFGVPPVTANVSNSIGLVPGSVTGAIVPGTGVVTETDGDVTVAATASVVIVRYQYFVVGTTPSCLRRAIVRVASASWAPDRIDRPITSTDSWIAVATIISGAARRPV